MGCCVSTNNGWDIHFKETELSSNRCDAEWENIKGAEATFGTTSRDFDRLVVTSLRFEAMPSLIRLKLGFAGGTTSNPTPNDFGDHTLVLNIEYDPSKMSFENLFYLFCLIQGILNGEYKDSQDQSTTTFILFYSTQQQKEEIEKTIAKEKQEKNIEKKSKLINDPILKSFTPIHEIRSLTNFISCDNEYQHLLLQSEPELMKLIGNRLLPHQMAHTHLACKLEPYSLGISNDTTAELHKALAELYVPEKVAQLLKRRCQERREEMQSEERQKRLREQANQNQKRQLEYLIVVLAGKLEALP